MQGRPDRGGVLYLVSGADPKSWDSTDPRHKGDGLMHPGMRIDADANGCWTREETDLGYPRACGLDFDYYFALVPEDDAERMDAEYKAEGFHGFKLGELSQLSVQLLDRFRIETDPCG